jgi:hypothetical protein
MLPAENDNSTYQCTCWHKSNPQGSLSNATLCKQVRNRRALHTTATVLHKTRTAAVYQSPPTGGTSARVPQAGTCHSHDLVSSTYQQHKILSPHAT